MAKRKIRGKQNKGSNPWRIFLAVLAVTLLAGGIVLAARVMMDQHRDSGQKGGAFQIARVDAEDIPAKQAGGRTENTGGERAADAEKPGEGEGAAAQEGGTFDGSGCIRDGNGRILERKIQTAGDEAVLLFAGDILLDDGYAMIGAMRERGGISACFSAETLREMEAADVFMLNNEFPYTDRGEPMPEKQFTFRAKPENAALLHKIGVDIVSLANNHSYDYGEVSLLDSLTALEGIDMPYVGAGRNLEEASRAVYFYAGNQKIACLAATQIERQGNPDTKGATKDSPGVFRCFTETEIFDRIAEAKANSDFVIVYVHWGTEKMAELDWAQPGLAKSLADAGADLVIGTHPHVLQPLAKMGDTPVIYSLGNYWFNSATLDTCLLKVTLKDGEMQSCQFLPARQSDCSTALLSGAEKEAVLAYMRGISPTVRIDEEGYVAF